MAFLANVLVVASFGLVPDGPAVQTTVVVPDGGTVLLGGLKSIPAPSPVVQTTVVVPDGGTVLIGGLKRLR
jgi:type II secretory pathway component GspD/PulD (secretin)